jgi:hypothetical protein
MLPVLLKAHMQTTSTDLGSELHLDVPYDGFKLLIQWLFHGKIELKKAELGGYEYEGLQSKVAILCKAYFASSTLGLPPVSRDRILDELVSTLTIQRKMHFKTLSQLIEIMTKWLPGASMGCKFLLDWLVHHDFSSLTHNYMGRFLGYNDYRKSAKSMTSLLSDHADLLERFTEMLWQQKFEGLVNAPWEDDTCLYHEEDPCEHCE